MVKNKFKQSLQLRYNAFIVCYEVSHNFILSLSLKGQSPFPHIVAHRATIFFFSVVAVPIVMQNSNGCTRWLVHSKNTTYLIPTIAYSPAEY